MTAPQAYLVAAVRTPTGRRNGSLKGVHPLDLAVDIVAEAVKRSGVHPSAIDDVILGCVDAIGPQAGDIARLAALGAGLPVHVPGVTIDRQCGSSQQAVHFAAQAVMSGTADVIIAGGVQNMSRVPIMSSYKDPLGQGVEPWAGSERWAARFGHEEISQFRGAELIAERWGISRLDMEQFALASHKKAALAIDGGRFETEMMTLPQLSVDETVRRDTTLEKMASLPTLRAGGRLTAAVASQISDGASAVVVASERAVLEHGLTPLARVVHMSVRGGDPIEMLSAPIPATQHALERAGLTPADIDVVEINEAFSSVVLAWQQDIKIDPERVNVNGGAIALGHPLGASGTRLMTSLVHELRRTGGRYGLQTMCEGGGQANVTILERM